MPCRAHEPQHAPRSICVDQIVMIRRAVTAAHRNDSEGLLALMMCEALLHILVERRVIRKNDVLEAIDTVAQIVAELGEHGRQPAGVRRRGVRAREAAAIIEEMRASFTAKS